MISSLIDFTGGILHGTVSCISGFMLDTIKVRIQIDPHMRGILQTGKHIIKTQGFLHLFNGIYYPLINLPIISSVIFFTYQKYKELRGNNSYSFINGIENGAVAGFFSGCVTTPSQLIKIRMQSDITQKYKHSKDCLRDIIRSEGIKGLFLGNSAMLFRQMSGCATQFSIYQHLKSYFITESHDHLTILETLIVCPPSTAIGWLFSYPQDIIKTNIQAQTEAYKKHRFLFDGGIIDCAKSIYRKHGMIGFFRGVYPCVIRAFYADSLGFVAYEKFRQFFWQYRQKH